MLAEKIRSFRHGGQPQRCASGIPALDRALGGGFTCGAVHEVLARGGSAALAVALLTATRAAQRRRWILYIDSTGDFYPPGAARLGVPLERMLVVRARHSLDVLWTLEQSLRCPALAAVVAPVRDLSSPVSRRLQLAAESGRGLGLLIRMDSSGADSFAASRILLEPVRGAMEACRLKVTVLKVREGSPPEPFHVELPDAADSLPASAASIDRSSAPPALAASA